jgi:hypothetical protein
VPTDEGVGKFHDDTYPSRRFAASAAEANSVADLIILSSALAPFIVSAGKCAREQPEQVDVIRARQLMDAVDDRLYLLSHTT